MHCSCNIATLYLFFTSLSLESLNLKFVPFQHSLSETLRTHNCQFQPRAVCAVPFVVLQTTLSFVSFVRVCHHHPQVAVSKTQKKLYEMRERRPFIGIPCVKIF